jgi:hypothetical protein
MFARAPLGDLASQVEAQIKDIALRNVLAARDAIPPIERLTAALG